MFTITYATADDKEYVCGGGEYFSESEYDLKVRDKRCYIIRIDVYMYGNLQFHMRTSAESDWFPLLKIPVFLF